MHVSVSRMISNRAAAINKANSSSERPWRSWSLESGADKDKALRVNFFPVSGRFLRERLAIGRMHEVKNPGTDFDR